MESLIHSVEQLKQHGVFGYILFGFLSIAGWVARSIASPRKSISTTQNVVGTVVIALPVGTTTGVVVKGLAISETFVSLQYIACYLSAVMSWNIVIYVVNTSISEIIDDIRKFKAMFKK